MEWYGARTFALIDKRYRSEASFSYRSQIRSTMEKANVDLVLDVGANEGQFVRQLRTFYSGQILSFEPVSSPFERLSQAAARDQNWQVQNVALGSDDSSQMINVADETVFSSILSTNDYGKERFGNRAHVRRQERIEIRRLDRLLDEAASDIDSRRIFLKMDTQGYDLEVFKGLGAKLKGVVALLSEVSLITIYEGAPHWTESIRIYEDAGFGVVGMFPVNRDSGRVIEYDCLLVRVPAP